jgi:hypothetical protein
MNAMTAARHPHTPGLGAERELLIRLAGPDDNVVLARLAALDSQAPLEGDSLIATVDGVAVAALSLEDGRLIADPFEHTAAVAGLLRMRATSIATSAPATAPRRRWLRLAPAG